MTNTEVWDRIAARQGDAEPAGVADDVSYGPGLPTEDDLRLCGDVKGRRVLDLGCGSGENAVVCARHGAHVIALDRSAGQLARARRLADACEARVEWHEGDVCDLAFLRADSIDLALALGVVGEVEDIDRLFRQVHRVLRPGAPFVFSFDHPMALAAGRSYFDASPAEVGRDDERIRVFPRTIASVFASLHRAGYRVDGLLEPQPTDGTDTAPSAVVWRARKEGV